MKCPWREKGSRGGEGWGWHSGECQQLTEGLWSQEEKPRKKCIGQGITKGGGIKKEGALDIANLYKDKEPSQASGKFETGVLLSNMLKYEASTNDENGSQGIRLRIWGIGK